MKTSLDLLPGVFFNKEIQKPNNSEKAVKEACSEFEALLLQKMLRSMRSTVPEGGFIKKGMAQKLFEEMQDEQVAREVAKSGTLGLADMMVQHMSDVKK